VASEAEELGASSLIILRAVIQGSAVARRDQAPTTGTPPRQACQRKGILTYPWLHRSHLLPHLRRASLHRQPQPQLLVPEVWGSGGPGGMLGAERVGGPPVGLALTFINTPVCSMYGCRLSSRVQCNLSNFCFLGSSNLRLS
jgi:hypothetical protein